MTPCSNVAGYQDLRRSEMLLSYHIITRCHNLEDNDMNLHRRENLKSRIKNTKVNVSNKRNELC